PRCPRRGFPPDQPRTLSLRLADAPRGRRREPVIGQDARGLGNRRPAQRRFPEKTAMRLRRIAQGLGSKQVLGVSLEGFGGGGREEVGFVLAGGLNPDSKVVDLGCGVLRGGYWLIHFLDPGRYFGIEPHAGRLENGIRYILEPATLKEKRPRFDTNPHFDTSVFGEKLDFFLAYSVWTHASRQQIEAMLDSFLRDSARGGVFLTSYLRSGWRHPAFKGAGWRGTSHESDVPGCIHHSFRWIREVCARRGLSARKLGKDKTHGQSWLEIRRSGN